MPDPGGAPRRSTSGEPCLEVREAYRRFGRIAALAGVSFRLGAGEWLGLVGPNGAGKTTLLRAIAGLVRLDYGEIRLLGQRVGKTGTRWRGRRGRRGRLEPGVLGVVPQGIALYSALTARENLEAFARFHGIRRRRREERVAWALDWTRLSAHAERPVATFSGGMQRRLNIACAVLHEPRVVLLDEPAVGVDPQGRSRIWEMLDGLRRAGASLLQSSHQLDEIESRCDRMIVLDDGKVVAAGTLDELAARLPVDERAVRLVLDRPPNGTHLPAGFDSKGRVVRGHVRDVSADLALLLERIRGAGLAIDHLELTRPRLEDVFSHLTGKELRE